MQTQWKVPVEKLSSRKVRDLARFSELQTCLKQCCTSLLHFVRRDFDALESADGDFLDMCRDMSFRQESLAVPIKKFEQRLSSMVTRIREKERLRIVFIGPLKAGKSTLINILLTSQQDACDALLPVGMAATTNRNWIVESSDGLSVEVWQDGTHVQSWPVHDGGTTVLNDVNDFLEEHFDRKVDPSSHETVTLKLPRAFLDPFGCHYCLVDTPGYTEDDSYEAMVTRFLQDHAHIACIVCPLTGGKALPQHARNLMKKVCSPTFWVLSRYDCLLQAKTRRKPSALEAEEVTAQFVDELKAFDSNAKIFRHAGESLMENQNHAALSLKDARTWLGAIHAHIQESFLSIQQEQHILVSQTRNCLDCSSDVLQKYLELKDSSTGAVASMEYYMKELQVVAEDACSALEREMHHAVQRLKGEELDRLCGAECDELKKATWLSKKAFCDALVGTIPVALDRRWRSLVNEVVQRSLERIAEVANRLVHEAGVAGRFGAATVSASVTAPNSDHYASQYPTTSVVTLSGAACGAGFLAVSEGGTALLANVGLRLGAGAIAGSVGVAVVGIATLGLAMQYAAQYQPVWSYTSVLADVVKRIRGTNHWDLIADAALGRARVHIQQTVAHFRYDFSQLLLAQGTPRHVLLSLFPDLPLFEAIHTKLETVSRDIEAFTDAPNLETEHVQSLKLCRDAGPDQVVQETDVLVGPNSRTDSVPGEALAELLYLRCESLRRLERWSELVHTCGLFQLHFPDLVFPRVCGLAAQVLSHGMAGSQNEDLMRERVSTCALDLARDVEEVPMVVSMWFHAVVASWLTKERETHVVSVMQHVQSILIEQMKTKPPTFQEHREHMLAQKAKGIATASQELGQDLFLVWRGSSGASPGPELEEVWFSYQTICVNFVTGIVNVVRLILATLPPSQVCLESLGSAVVKQVWTTITQELSKTSAQSMVEPRVRDELLNSGTNSFHEMWLRILDELLVKNPPPPAG